MKYGSFAKDELQKSKEGMKEKYENLNLPSRSNRHDLFACNIHKVLGKLKSKEGGMENWGNPDREKATEPSANSRQDSKMKQWWMFRRVDLSMILSALMNYPYSWQLRNPSWHTRYQFFILEWRNRLNLTKPTCNRSNYSSVVAFSVAIDWNCCSSRLFSWCRTPNIIKFCLIQNA